MNAPFLQSRFVRAEIDKLIAAYPELAEDETLRLDMIEGETDFTRVLSKAVEARAEKLMMAKAINLRVSDLVDRAVRFERAADGIKSLIHGLMDAAGQDKVTLPEATIFTTKPRTSVNVLNVDDLPQGYFRVKREADKTAIKSALEQGEQIPGAELVLGDAGLTIRTK